MEKIPLREAARRVNVPYTTCARWVQSGLIRLRGYERTQAVKVRLGPKEMKELRALSQLRILLSSQELKKAMHRLRQHIRSNPLSSGCFVLIGGSPKKRRLIKLYGDEQTVGLTKENRGQFLMCLFFGED